MSRQELFPSPHSGILFLWAFDCILVELPEGYVSVPSFGDSFFIKSLIMHICISVKLGFRPLIRGFFFYSLYGAVVIRPTFSGFRPLIRGFFFYTKHRTGGDIHAAKVSVPSFGDSFFIINKEDIGGTVSPFPSPHSGILFLSARQNV